MSLPCYHYQFPWLGPLTPRPKIKTEELNDILEPSQ